MDQTTTGAPHGAVQDRGPLPAPSPLAAPIGASPGALLSRAEPARPHATKEVCVVGLGYIGLPTASLLCSRGYRVRGVDL
ncbi:MAG: hypothetical protein AAFP86_17920, partial [Planctomycetota bacterium]